MTYASTQVLRRGSRGDTVAALQQALLAAGFDPGPADGIYGARTESAVRQFQAARGLAVDGIAGPRTLEALGRSSARPAPAPTPAPTSGTDWSTVPGDDRMRYVVRRLVETYGYPINGAAGVVGNLWAESGVIPPRIEGSRPETPLRARDFDGNTVAFTADQVMNRDKAGRVGPRLPGVGLAQWTSAGRRSGLFAHRYNGLQLGAAVLFDMDAQVDYLDHELQQSYRRVHGVLTRPGVTVDDAADEVLYKFEVPGSILAGGAKLPRQDARVQAVFRQRRKHAARALRVSQ